MRGRVWWRGAVLMGLWVGALGGCTLRKQQTTNEAFERALAEHNAGVERKERIICRKERVVGSHFKERVCRYQWQLDEGQMEGRAAIDEIQNNMRMTDSMRRE